MFDRLTVPARRVIVAAEQEARSLNHPRIGTEHLLLGLLAEREEAAGQVLRSAGLSTKALRQAVAELVGHLPEAPSGDAAFTPRATRVLELAFHEALDLGHDHIGTEHLLLGLIREGRCTAVQLLLVLGADPTWIRAQLLRLLAALDDEPFPAMAGTARTGARRSDASALDEFGRNLTQVAREGRLDPVIGRDGEIERVLQVLSRRTKNNPVLIGEPGVGKTAVVEELARRIAAGRVPGPLAGTQIYALDLAAVLAGSRYRGDFEERMTRVLREVGARDDVILFIDEMHQMVGAGAVEGSIDAASMLKPILARGQVRVIGAATADDHRRHLRADAALERRFQPIQVGEPGLTDAIEMLKGLRGRYETYHHVSFTDAALVAAATLADRYISDRYLPDKAIDLIDEAGARMRIQGLSESGHAVVEENQIAEVLANWTGIPVYKLTEEETSRLLRMEDELHKRVVGQEDAVKAVSKAIRRTRAGLKDPKRPSGSFIFAGPSGVGKTELSKALAEFLFGSEDALIQLDMSEFHDRYTVSRLVGAPPGYVGYDEGGQLTEKVRRRPFSVVLFDEIEKAHPDVFNTLLQILEDGRLTDGQGRIVDFKNTVIILTTNLGTRDVAKAVSLGFQASEDSESNYERMKQKVNDELKQHFRPEFLNRIDDTIVFHQLQQAEILEIVDIMIARIETQLRNKDMSMELTDSAKRYLAVKGFDPVLGARPLRRTIQRDIEDNLSERILFNELKPGQIVVVDCEGDPAD
ncbi:ATP-dependent Clp protease ATP-binding subunit, partial [Phytohabitans sp. ZYX-F-186]